MRWRNRPRCECGVKRNELDSKWETVCQMWYTWEREFISADMRRKEDHVSVSSPVLTVSAPSLADIECLDEETKTCFEQKLVVHPALTRSLVSFQANKGRPIHRWYKYKEAFSASLVEYLFERYKVTAGRVLDPFAGIGTALFTASSLGIDAEGIELLPIGQQVIAAKKTIFTKWPVSSQNAHGS